MNTLIDVMPWVHALGLSLVHFIWQGLLIGALFALARAMIPVEHSSLRYASGLAALALLALCPLATVWMLRPASEMLLVSAADPVAVALTGGIAHDSPENALSSFLPWLVAVWMFGVGVAISRTAHQWRLLNRIATQLAYRQQDVEDVLARIARSFGGLQRVRVLVSRHIDTPTLIGWFNPVILLPTAVVLGFPRQQLELIVAHELGHLRRHDHLVNLLQAAIEMLLFYHPVVHWISREVRHEREVCCDALVLQMTEREPHEYARTLAALENVRQIAPRLAVSASGGHLLDRVRRIIGLRHAEDVHSHRGAWLLAAASLTVVIAVVVFAEIQHEEPILAFAVPAPALAAMGSFDVLARASSAELATFAMTRPFRVRLPAATIVDDGDASSDVSASIIDAVVVAAQDPSDRVSTPEYAEPVQLPSAIAAVAGRNVVADGEAPTVSMTPIAAPPLAKAAPIRPKPRIVRRVDPVYPDINVSSSRGYVEFEFALDDNGTVRDIKLVSGEALAGFTVAARKALRQWRFSPASARAFKGERFRQDFVFAGLSDRRHEVQDKICQRDTGSNLCRPGRSLGLITNARPVGSIEPTELGDTVTDTASAAPSVEMRAAAEPPSSGTPDAGL